MTETRPRIDMSKVPLTMNSKYHRLLTQCDERFFVLWGSAGSGKSRAVAQAIVYLTMLQPGHHWLVARKVAKTLKGSVVEEILSVLKAWNFDGLYQHNKTDLGIVAYNGNRITFVGLDDVEKLKSISGITGAWLEETTEFTRRDLTQINLRIRGRTKVKKRLFLTFNPIIQTHWLKSYFFDTPRDDALLLHTTYRDNAFLDDDYRAELEKLKDVDPYFYQVYALGEWGQLGNLVFSNYVIENFEYGAEDLENVRGGMDFGYNHPSAIARVGFRDGEIYIFDEFYQTHLTNSELIDRAKEFDPQYGRNYYTADSAEPDRIKEFNQAGFRVEPARKGKDSIRHGVDFIKRHRVHIHASRCPNIAKEWQGYKYREDRDGNVIDEPVDFNNHGIDAVRYALEDIWAGGEIGVLVI